MEHQIIVVTALIESNDNFSNQTRLKQLNEVLKNLDENNLLILPGGFLNFTKLTKMELEEVEVCVKDILKQQKKNLVVCFGIDAAQGKDQFGLAIWPALRNKSG